MPSIYHCSIVKKRLKPFQNPTCTKQSEKSLAQWDNGGLWCLQTHDWTFYSQTHNQLQHAVVEYGMFLMSSPKILGYISVRQSTFLLTLGNRWTIEARPGFKPRAFCLPCDQSTFELPSHLDISPATVHHTIT